MPESVARPAPPAETPALLRRLVADQGRAHWKGYLLAFVFMAMIAATTSLSAYLMRDVINEVFIARNQSAIWMLSGAVVVLYTVKGFATYGQQITLTRIANAIVASVQRRLYGHMLAMDVPFFAERHTSEFVGRLSFVATSSAQVLNALITVAGRDFLSLLGLVTVMIVQDPMLSIVGGIVMPLAVWGVQGLVKRAKKIMRSEFAGGMAVLETMQETVRGIRVVKAFGLEDLFRTRMEGQIATVQAAADKRARVGARSVPLMETLGGFAVAGVILYGGWRVVASGATPGTFFSFITALLLAYEPAKRLARVHVELSANLVGVGLLYEFLGQPAREAEAADMPELAVAGGRVEFADVRFAYRDGEDVLNGLSLVAEAGRTTALVGPSGGGKSTIFALLLRFWDPRSGSITVDGTAIDAVSRRSLRHRIGIVSQDVFLFAGTVAENIALGRPGASRAEIEAAARAAYAHDFIVGFRDGYDAPVGENGLQLSGGQRQRIAIARAILEDAPILLLDEATAALDTESERAIQEALAELSKNRTTLVIAHRLQTIQRADKICVIESGRVVEQGRHDDLLAARGRYARLHEVQFG
ncbi:ABC transporter ATP-binding protein [Pinisolibacter sp.]|uniref:ABC transporter ATP-binding protein n=1 Tax=Pinisolibacter sp. TaxID=2172024 RepID=UPI002FDEFC8A